MRALSAIGFVISILGLLLVSYNQFAVVPLLSDLQNTTDIHTEYTIQLRQEYEFILFFISTLSIIIGVFSVLFCSILFLKKRTRMTFLGIIFGAIVTILGVVHSWI
jgi:hypothetical protein